MIDNTEGDYVAERIRASSLAVGDSSPVEAMLANALREGKPLADDGALHDTVQGAQDAASSFVFVPPGTFNESVTVDTPGLTLFGSGETTVIDGGSSDPAIFGTTHDITIENITARVNSGNSENSINGGSDWLINSAHVIGSNGNAISIIDDSIVTNSFIESDFQGIRPSGERSKVTNCIIRDTGSSSIGIAGPDTIITGNIIINSDSNGIALYGGANSDDCIVGYNRIIDSTNEGISINGNDNIVFNNRVSGSGSADIDDSGTGTVLDANLTGPAN